MAIAAGRRCLPPPELFDQALRREAQARPAKPHDRLALDYAPDLPLAPPWREFVAELAEPGATCSSSSACSDAGRSACCSHWHYTPNGCSVSPHCDAKRKLGSHIFYLNTDKDWQADWGGETLILDDNGRFGAGSAPQVRGFRPRHAANGDRQLLACCSCGASAPGTG